MRGREPRSMSADRFSLAQRVTRCLTVSVGTTLLSAAILVALSLGAGLPAGTSNVIAVCCGIVPSYLANRSWVWRQPGRGSMLREVAPFWLLSLAGLALSTIAVAEVASLTASWTTAARSIALPFANLSVFGALWIVQFVVLDRVLFAQSARPSSKSVRQMTEMSASAATSTSAIQTGMRTASK
jgi:putative flippase GtrA